MKKREVKSQKQEQNGHKKGARNKRGGYRPGNSLPEVIDIVGDGAH
jgi:hypothetical protein